MNCSLKTKRIIRKTNRYLAHHYNILDLSLEKASGVWMEDADGNKYLDMMAQYSALGFGSNCSRVLEAVRKEFEHGAAILPGSVCNSTRAEFAQVLAKFTSMAKVLAMNSGGETFDTAVKIARRWAYQIKGVPENRANIILCKNLFHGRTVAATSASTVEHYKDGFGPFLPGFKWVEFGNIQALKRAINSHTAAFIVEPVQGEGGIHVPYDGYLADVKEVCQSNQVLFIADEVQTGFGRTGYKFGWMHDKAKPDMMMLAKMLGAGAWPVSAVVAGPGIMDVLDPGSHGSTFGGVPAACAAALEVIKIFNEHKDLIPNVKKLGEYFKKELEYIKEKNKYIKQVRGRGLLIGIELTEDGLDAKNLQYKLLEKGIFCGTTQKRVLRISPPLIITKEEIDFALERIEFVLKGVV